MNLFNLVAQITLDDKDYNKSLKDVERETENVGSKWTKVGKLGKVAFTAVAAATTTAAAGVGKLAKESVIQYARYEQLVGGVETLFKDSSNLVMDYAEQAYITAGLSANEYMDQITSFAASLMQGVKGDTVRAAELGNRAVLDMGDNMNKMGSSMRSISDAYNGFAKDNFTMLDNLKLGKSVAQYKPLEIGKRLSK